MKIIFSQLWQLFGYRLCVWARDGIVAKRPNGSSWFMVWELPQGQLHCIRQGLDPHKGRPSLLY